MAGYFVIAAVCGLVVASAEIMARYRDEPLKAAFCWWGISYLLFNLGLSAVAFWVLIISGTVAKDNSVADNVKYAVLAGFGAVVIMRAKIFNIKTLDGEQVGVGPDFVITTYLGMMDRQIDRHRAMERSQIVKKMMLGIDFQAVRMSVITLLMKSMQHLSKAEIEDLGVRVKEIENAEELTNQDKANALGFIILDYGGQDFFQQVFTEQERAKYMISPAAAQPAP